MPEPPDPRVEQFQAAIGMHLLSLPEPERRAEMQRLAQMLGRHLLDSLDEDAETS